MFKGTLKRKYPPCVSSVSLANKFADFFENKIDNIRKDLLSKPIDPTRYQNTETVSLPNDAKLESFIPISMEEQSVLTRKIAENSCILDPIPSKVLMECFTDLLPLINKITNDSLDIATVHDNLKCATIAPRLKKDTLSSDEFSSFRPISNLKMVYKCIEKVIAVQLDQHITRNNLVLRNITEISLTHVLRSREVTTSSIFGLILAAAFCARMTTLQSSLLKNRISTRYQGKESLHILAVFRVAFRSYSYICR
jgi:hypothetical protein